jgi:hypothetical protein
MERIVKIVHNIYVCLIRRKHYRMQYVQALRKVRHAKRYLEQDFFTRASTLDRGYLLPAHEQALFVFTKRDKQLRTTIEDYF